MPISIIGKKWGIMYSGLARGSPWVVPSCDKMTSPSTKSSVGLLYELAYLYILCVVPVRLQATYRL